MKFNGKEVYTIGQKAFKNAITKITDSKRIGIWLEEPEYRGAIYLYLKLDEEFDGRIKWDRVLETLTDEEKEFFFKISNETRLVNWCRWGYSKNGSKLFLSVFTDKLLPIIFDDKKKYYYKVKMDERNEKLEIHRSPRKKDL